jgi:hypothetical protein
MDFSFAALISAALPQRKARETVRDIVAGTISGIAGKLIEYPFDTLKVRMQTAYNGARARRPARRAGRAALLADSPEGARPAPHRLAHF